MLKLSNNMPKDVVKLGVIRNSWLVAEGAKRKRSLGMTAFHPPVRVTVVDATPTIATVTETEVGVLLLFRRVASNSNK